MTEEQIKTYFKGAEYIGNDLGSTGTNFTSDGLLYKTKSNKEFVIQYYHGIKPSQMHSGLKQTNKLNGVDILDSDYAIAKSAW